MKVFVIKTNGEKVCEEINCFEDLQDAIGGSVQFVHFTKGMTFAVDEEGLVKDKVINKTLYIEYGLSFAGDVAFLGQGKMEELDKLPYSRKELEDENTKENN